MKTLTPCSYCAALFEDEEKSGICDTCTPKYFIDNALASIYQGICDLEDAYKIEREHMLHRNEQIKTLVVRLSQLQQVE
jgi:hypothetical protein